MRHVTGFTLIEVAAVVLLMALLAVAAGLSLSGRYRQVAMERVVQQLVHQDRLARQQARLTGRSVQLVFDLDQAKVTRSNAHDTQPAQPWSLPPGYRLIKIFLLGRSVDQGQIAVSYSQRGWSPSYILWLSGPENQSTRLLIIGLSGQVMEVTDEGQLKALCEALAMQGHDPA